jgi:Right handed beta helix region
LDGGYDEDGVYCDGCSQVVFERNLIYANDINVEAASEISGEVSSDVIIRNNVTYGANSAGMTVGGYAKSGTGGSTNITIVNNSLYDDDLQDTGSGEFQIQYRATCIVFENNSVYAVPKGLFLFGYVSGSGVTLNNNDYYTTSSTTTFELNGTKYSSFASYQSATGQDEESKFANPQYDSLPSCSATGTTRSGGFSRASYAGPDFRPTRQARRSPRHDRGGDEQCCSGSARSRCRRRRPRRVTNRSLHRSGDPGNRSQHEGRECPSCRAAAES